MAFHTGASTETFTASEPLASKVQPVQHKEGKAEKLTYILGNGRQTTPPNLIDS
jgi:hypothetical protein